MFGFFPDALCEKQLQAFADTINPHQVCMVYYFLYFIIILVDMIFILCRQDCG